MVNYGPGWLRFPQLWLNLQARHDLEVVRDRLGDRLEREVVAVS